MELRSGFTTGSCAAAAAKAALMMLLDSVKASKADAEPDLDWETAADKRVKDIEYVNIMTPKGIPFYAEIVNVIRDESGKKVTCSVIKDGGDDPDVTTGAYIEVSVRIKDTPGIVIDGGKGVGRVTKPGLDRAIGEAAINSVPRKMIEENLNEVLKERNAENTGLEVIVSVPGGEKIAEKTFNPKLGIVGGISILGTTGIVEPMSEKAIVDTIRTEIRVRKAEGRQVLLAAPGNYGITFLSKKCGIDKDIAVMTSNFVYDSVMIAKEEGFSEMVFAGHIGKLVKVAGGIKNTHSRYGDHRMEILTDITGMFSEGKEFDELKEKLSECVMTDEAVRIITEAGVSCKVFPKMASLIKENMEKWAEGTLKVEVIVFSNEYTELVSTVKAHEYLERTT
ncbi:cobalt-precorrin-5B (C1)-methyltransferase [Butyrivibrio hungatei]|uniref:Cobalt-precorrin-5B C(1)-methyltransferase n=1 Tax=Butyrivibrio hungatei TaxID=185008 RepID=A0A1G5AKX7_9FIRM|nr:cobalt-precorrin-5B (C(1))-methyltransferase CbiD [Butyrivibrio hungatei]SCX78511.1 cobalt-precorrin-5B (C1)-methyltransferase [Butyrivibrio hungatei]